MPDIMQLLKLICEMSCEPTEFANIQPETAQLFYNIIALWLFIKLIPTPSQSLYKVKKKIHVRLWQNDDACNDDVACHGFRLLYSIQVTCKVCLWIVSNQKLEEKCNWRLGKQMTELVEIAQHHWDSTEQKEQRMQELLMFAQVFHYTGGAVRGGNGGRGAFKREKWDQIHASRGHLCHG